jgi:hypothetical protein
MKQRPPLVVHRNPRRHVNGATTERRATPDGTIRTWRDTDPKPTTSAAQMQSEIASWVSRLRRANDPEVHRDAADKLAHRDAAETEMASVISMPNHPLGPGYFVVAKKGAFNRLGRSLRSLFSRVVFPSAKAPDRPPSSLQPFIKSMRKGEDW